MFAGTRHAKGVGMIIIIFCLSGLVICHGLG
jgi:hypothetical protein